MEPKRDAKTTINLSDSDNEYVKARIMEGEGKSRDARENSDKMRKIRENAIQIVII